MSHTPDPERIERRADELWPEEQRAGSDDPEGQAEQILRESDERTEDPERTGADQRPGGPEESA